MTGANMLGEKGLSPLIAVVLLIAFTITVATFVAAFSQSFVREQTTGFQQTTEQLRAACRVAQVQIKAVTYDDVEDKVSALVQNIGPPSLSNFTVLTFSSDVNFTEHTPSNSGDTLSQGDLKTFTVTGVTARPTKVGIVSKTCPVEARYECRFEAGIYLC